MSREKRRLCGENQFFASSSESEKKVLSKASFKGRVSAPTLFYIVSWENQKQTGQHFEKFFDLLLESKKVEKVVFIDAAYLYRHYRDYWKKSNAKVPSKFAEAFYNSKNYPSWKERNEPYILQKFAEHNDQPFQYEILDWCPSLLLEGGGFGGNANDYLTAKELFLRDNQELFTEEYLRDLSAFLFRLDRIKRDGNTALTRVTIPNPDDEDFFCPIADILRWKGLLEKGSNGLKTPRDNVFLRLKEFFDKYAEALYSEDFKSCVNQESAKFAKDNCVSTDAVLGFLFEEADVSAGLLSENVNSTYPGVPSEAVASYLNYRGCLSKCVEHRFRTVSKKNLVQQKLNLIVDEVSYLSDQRTKFFLEEVAQLSKNIIYGENYPDSSTEDSETTPTQQILETTAEKHGINPEDKHFLELFNQLCSGYSSSTSTSDSAELSTSPQGDSHQEGFPSSTSFYEKYGVGSGGLVTTG